MTVSWHRTEGMLLVWKLPPNAVSRTPTCLACGKKGHLNRACHSRVQKQPTCRRNPSRSPIKQTQWVQVEPDENSGGPDSDLPVLNIAERSRHPITEDLEVNGKALTMEVDTGAAVFTISEQTQRKVFQTPAYKGAPWSKGHTPKNQWLLQDKWMYR